MFLTQHCLRPGRFDRRVNIGLPDRKDREAILKVHFAKKPLAKDVDLDALAAKTAGSSGADLANIANESAIIAARNSHTQIISRQMLLKPLKELLLDRNVRVKS